MLDFVKLDLPKGAASITIERKWYCNQCEPSNGALEITIQVYNKDGFLLDLMTITEKL